MQQFIRLFKKVGGKEVLRQYWQCHVLLFALVQTALLGFSKKSLEIVRLSVNNRILCKLRKKNRKAIAEFCASQKQLPKEQSNKVWVLWLQGMEQAPYLVQRCFRSLQENLPHKEIVLLTEENYRSYVTFPEYIQSKIDDGTITKTHMSDLLRLELLIAYGGTWIDGTVFLSGNKIPEYMTDSDLFVFQALKPGLEGQAICISSWFMTACTNHPILLLTRHLLYRYWQTHKTLADYFLLHDFFQLAIEAYPEEWEKVVPFSNDMPHVLLLRLFEQYDPVAWEAVAQVTPVHKLSYKFQQEQTLLSGTYYDTLICDK